MKKDRHNSTWRGKSAWESYLYLTRRRVAVEIILAIKSINELRNEFDYRRRLSNGPAYYA